MTDLGLYPEVHLAQELVGWTISGIEESPNIVHGYDEFFIIVADKDGERKRVTICGTDLGWWLGEIETASL